MATSKLQLYSKNDIQISLSSILHQNKFLLQKCYYPFIATDDRSFHNCISAIVSSLESLQRTFFSKGMNVVLCLSTGQISIIQIWYGAFSQHAYSKSVTEGLHPLKCPVEQNIWAESGGLGKYESLDRNHCSNLKQNFISEYMG